MDNIAFTYSRVKNTRTDGIVELTLLNDDMIEVFYGFVKRETANRILNY